MLHLWLGHLNDPDRLKERGREHIRQMIKLRDGAAARATNARAEPSWAFAQIVMDWALRHYQHEITMAEELLDQIDDAAAAKVFGHCQEGGNGLPNPIDPAK